MRTFRQALIVVVLLAALALLLYARAQAGVQNVERVSVGSSGVEANRSSFYVHLSQNGRFVTFESWASNWAPDGDVNFVDIFMRDRVANVTRKVTFSHTGSTADESSFDPIITADGRYIVYNSYARNLVPHDDNGDIPFTREGIDLFLYDWNTGTNQRVSLNDQGEEINGNSVGTITPDGNYVIFASNGRNVIEGDSNPYSRAALYLRNWRTGEIERLTHGIDGQFPNGGIDLIHASYDGRYIIFRSEASNLVPGDTNGVADVFMYDRQTKTTRIVSRPANGIANEHSSPGGITYDGQYAVFRSFASNLVPNDTNGEADIFLYETATGNISRVNLAPSGQQANHESKEPSICGNGRFVSFTSDATNLVPGDTNNQRDVFLVDLERNEVFVVTKNDQGEWGNGRAHRSFIAADCRTIGFSTEASNIIPDDTNGSRDLFVSEVTWPADFSQSSRGHEGGAAPGDTITYTFTLRNEGTETAVATFEDNLPANATYLSGSLSGGPTYHPAENKITWSGELAGESEMTFSFAVTTPPGLTEFTIINNQAILTGDGQNYDLSTITVFNGLRTYLPLAAKNE